MAALTVPLARSSRGAERQARIALVSPGPETPRQREESLVAGLRELGHVPGRTFRVEQRLWNGDPKTIEPLLSEVLAAAPDVLVVAGLSVVTAAKRATTSVPIVVANASDLVAAGIVGSYAKPGGNITGFTTLTDVLTGKRLEVLLEAVPAVRRVMLLQNPVQPQSKGIEQHVRKVAAALRVELAVANASDQAGLQTALDRLGQASAQAVLVASHAIFRAHSTMLIDRALKHKACVAHWLPYAAEQGALLVLGVDDAKQHRRAATYVDRILKGAHPRDLPIEQVASEELILNLKTARTLGLNVSQSVLLRASKVIR
jgi:putative tryptophan/tyrosine transport system substrate-binding protein